MNLCQMFTVRPWAMAKEKALESISRASQAEVREVVQLADEVRMSVGRVIVGKSEVIDQVLVAIFSEGHILFEDVPGLGKTILARSLARSLDCAFQRIQFTPDLLPSDVTGLSIFNQKNQEFEYRPGPILTNVLLADEINRATPRTQSALLEAMAERQVTIDGESRLVPRPFIVMATQNPVELEGTFPLPEAQLDRFTMRLSVGYPTADEEIAIARRFAADDPLEHLTPVASKAAITRAISICRRVFVGDAVGRYIISLIRATRESEAVLLGASPRATLALWHGAQARAAIADRAFVLPDDVKAIAPVVLAHRLIVRPDERARGRTELSIVDEVLERVPVPIDEDVAPATG